MRRVVFYSWQSDLPNATNRGFIQQALEHAAKGIGADKNIDIEPVVDRDTQGVAGSPDIAKTIFTKISAADVFVADVSIIAGGRGKRLTPNPNVLIELGYAVHALGEDSVILVMNDAYGRPEHLPFDLKMRRVITYSMPESAAERAPERKSLERKLDAALREAFKTTTKKITAEALPDFAGRLSKHKKWAISKLADTTDLGHLGLYCIPYGSPTLSVDELIRFGTQHKVDFSEFLRHYPSPEPHQNGVSFGFYTRVENHSVNRARVTLYADGLVAFDSQAYMDFQVLGDDVPPHINLNWVPYEIQRHLQLSKALLEPHGVSRARVQLELDNIEEHLALAGLGPYGASAQFHEYGGDHGPVIRDIPFNEIPAHDGPDRNNLAPPVRNMVDEVARIFGLRAAPADIVDEKGNLTYVRGMENTR